MRPKYFGQTMACNYPIVSKVFFMPGDDGPTVLVGTVQLVETTDGNGNITGKVYQSQPLNKENTFGYRLHPTKEAAYNRVRSIHQRQRRLAKK